MDIALQIVIILVSCGALWKGATYLVDAAARIAKKVGISELVIGLTVVAFGTSAPEFAVTISAALGGRSNISMGNVIGSNIFNIGFILGICAIVLTIKIRSVLVWRDGILLFLSTVLLLWMLGDCQLSRGEGVVLTSILVGYLLFLFWKRDLVMDEEVSQQQATWRDGPLLIAGLVLVIGGGHFLVTSAVKLAETFGLSEWVIAFTIVAAGTSVPEFAVSMAGLIKKHHGISAGNLIGSNLFNTLGVLGMAAAIRPLEVESSALVSLAAQAGITLVVVLFMWTGKKVSRWEGVVLILLSLAIWVYNFTASR